jgi:glycosyltransferase involved in cell wall biosynthesis
MNQRKQIKTINILHIDSYNQYGGAQKSTINSLKAIGSSLKLSKLHLNSSDNNKYNDSEYNLNHSSNCNYNFNFYVIHNANKVYEEELNNIGIPNFSIQMKNFGDIFAIIKIAKFLRKYKIDIIIFHSSKDQMLGGIACFLSGRRIVKILTRHVAYNISMLKGFLIYHLLTDHYIAISKYIKNILINNLRIKESKITVIYDIRFTGYGGNSDNSNKKNNQYYYNYNNDNREQINNLENKTEIEINSGIETKTAAKTKPAIAPETEIEIETNKTINNINDVKMEFGIQENEKIISIIGRLSNEKGHATFLNAAKQIIKKRKDIKFLIIGSGDLFDTVKKFIINNNLSNYIIMTGFKKEIEKYISASDLIVVPSGLEGLGGIIVESCIEKKAVIASNVGGIPEIINNNLTGILFEKDNYNELSDKILDIIDDKKMLNDLGTNCYKKITEEFNPYKLADENIALYCRLVKKFHL